MLRVLAILCIRNEEIHIRRCIKDLVRSDVDVFLIDNDSNDNSLTLAQDYLGEGLIGIQHMPWDGHFSLSEQLRVKRKIMDETDYDWFLHVDADEWLCSSIPGQTLHEGICEADSKNYTVINFHEIVFVPINGEDYYIEDYAEHMKNYYFFQPSYPRLNRAWKRSANLHLGNSGGHRLEGSDLRIFPRDFYLRHYIALSESHAREKYIGRVFSDEDLRRGWHGNRRMITADNLAVKSVASLKSLATPSQQDFDLSMPLKHHFWHW